MVALHNEVACVARGIPLTKAININLQATGARYCTHMYTHQLRIYVCVDAALTRQRMSLRITYASTRVLKHHLRIYACV